MKNKFDYSVGDRVELTGTITGEGTVVEIVEDMHKTQGHSWMDTVPHYAVELDNGWLSITHPRSMKKQYED